MFAKQLNIADDKGPAVPAVKPAAAPAASHSRDEEQHPESGLLGGGFGGLSHLAASVFGHFADAEPDVAGAPAEAPASTSGPGARPKSTPLLAQPHHKPSRKHALGHEAGAADPEKHKVTPQEIKKAEHLRKGLDAQMAK